MFDKIYIVNLKKSTDRFNTMTKEMEKHQLTNYLFFEAIDGENEKLDENFQFSIINHWRDPFTRRTITKGEIGCALTHYWIWEEIVNHQYSSILVLEDDVVLEENFLEKLNKIDIPKNMDFLYLGRGKPRTNSPEKEINKDIVIPNYSYGTYGYILSLEGAKKLLTYNYLQYLFPIDEFLPMIYDSNYPYKIMKSYFVEPLKEPMNFYCLKDKLVNTFNTESITTVSSPYINLKNPVQNFIILSIATQITDGYKRFIESCDVYGNPYKILGLNTEWKGDGYKLLLLYEELSTWSIEKLESTIILYTDCYDVIITSNYKDIVTYYKTFDTTNILFQANKKPIPLNLNDYYPETTSPYKYLNAGGFIGYGNKIFELLNYSLQQIVPTNLQEIFKSSKYYNTNKWVINEHIYFSFLYLQKKIVLDTACKLFQPIFESAQDLGVTSNWCVTNNNLKTTPLIIQSSKNNRIILNQLSNYLINGWSPYLNYKLIKQIVDYPIIFIYCKNTFVNTLDYPSDKIILCHDENFAEQFLTSEAQYLFYCYNDFIIENKNILTILLKTNKDIIAPMFVYNNNVSNFWTINDADKQTSDYLDIIQYKRKYIFNVSHIQDIYLLNKQVLLDYPNLYKSKLHNNPDISFSLFLRNKNKFMFVTNIEVFGKINENVSIYDYNFNWKNKFIHPKIYEEWNELGDDVFSFPLFTPEFCSQLIKICNDKNDWSPGKDCKDIDKRIGFIEPVPTQDTHLKQIKLDTIWSNIMEEYIKPLIYTKFKYTTIKEKIAFVVRYIMSEQTNLKPHHDSSTYTLNICLSDTFEGGGCRFIRQNKTVINNQIGYCIMHPGKLTHFHEALPITSGERYILVSFVD